MEMNILQKNIPYLGRKFVYYVLSHVSHDTTDTVLEARAFYTGLLHILVFQFRVNSTIQ